MNRIDEAQANLQAARLAHEAARADLERAKALCADCGGEDDEMGEPPSHTNINAPERFGLRHREHAAEVESAYSTFADASRQAVEAEERLTLAVLTTRYAPPPPA